MTAKEFIRDLKDLTPHISQFYGLPDDFAETYISQFNIERKNSFIWTEPEDCVIDLVLNYNLHNLTIGIFSFWDKFKENELFIIFGSRDSFPLAISKESKEIVELDWGNEYRVVSYVAKTQSAYLDLLIRIEKLNQQLLFEMISHSEWKDQIVNLFTVAGGTKYKAQLEDL